MTSVEAILQASVSDELRAMGMRLLKKDQQGELSYDGLERGIVSVRFITTLIGSKSHFEGLIDLDRLGIVLQIVDDVLDYEDDIRFGDTNCLCSANARDYLKLLLETLPRAEVVRLFPNACVLRFVIRRANAKAKELLASTVLAQRTSTVV